MGMIKIPDESINYFKSNLDEIFKTGFLAEGDWNKKLELYVNKMTRSTCSVSTNSNGAGLVALLTIYKYYFSFLIINYQVGLLCFLSLKIKI